ncbi:MAG: YkvA family protein [Synechococcus sp.]
MAFSSAAAGAAPAPEDPFTAGAAGVELEAEVLESQVVDEALLRRLLRRAGRLVARPSLECLELLLDGNTPYQVRFTVLAALTYLLVPIDLIPDFFPVAGFSDDLVALSALLGLCSRHLTPDIRRRAQRRLDRWFPPGR